LVSTNTVNRFRTIERRLFPGLKFLGLALVISLVATAGFAQVDNPDAGEAVSGGDVLDDFRFSGEDGTGVLALVRGPYPLRADKEVLVHERIRDYFLVSGPPAAIERLRGLGFSVIRIGTDPPQRSYPLRVWQPIVEPSPTIQAVVDQVIWEGVRSKIQGLQDFGTRLNCSSEHDAAAQTLRVFFENLGLDTRLHHYSQAAHLFCPLPDEGDNVIATQPGVLYPDSIIVICAHYDCIAYNHTNYEPSAYAPGADDNASGVAAVMTAAELLSKHRFAYTIQYICFGGEEFVTCGSREFVRESKRNRVPIVGALNFDMIGYWQEGASYELEVEANEPSVWLAEAVMNAAELYTDMPCRLHVTDIGWSDNASFWVYRYPALNHEEAWGTGPDFNPYWHTYRDEIQHLDPGFTVENVKVAVAALATLADLQPPPAGAIAGRGVADCSTSDAGLFGVVVDACDAGSGELVGSATTDEDGEYEITELAVGDHLVTVVPPLGYEASSETTGATVSGGETTQVDYSMTCLDTRSRPRGVWFWKIRFHLATRPLWRKCIDNAALCEYLDLIEAHFNNNPVNPVVVYEPPTDDGCMDKLYSAKTVLIPGCRPDKKARAEQHLMALLLNVASGRISSRDKASKDGATVSQAITYCDYLIDNADTEDLKVAKHIAERLNRGWAVRAGLIRLDIHDIAYSPYTNEEIRAQFALESIYPNPSNPTTTISYSVPEAGPVTLRIYDVNGRLVRVLVSDSKPAGEHAATWNGRDEQGRPAASGVYFVQLESGPQSVTRKIVLLR
jgi:hypothetical protein